MYNKTREKDIKKVVTNVSELFRGNVNPLDYKNYILAILFLKYLNDINKEILEEYMDRYDGNLARVERAMSRERFIIDKKSTFDYLYSKRKDNNIGEIINDAFAKLEEDNIEKLNDVFTNIDFNREDLLGNTKNRNILLRNLLEEFNTLNLSREYLEDSDILGNSYQYILEKFAINSGRLGGEIFTPTDLSQLLARIVEPEEDDRIYDPTCGSGSLLIKTAKRVPYGKVAIYGQDINESAISICKMNMFINNMYDAQIVCGDTLSNPLFYDENNKLMKFDKIVANPPMGLINWSKGFHKNSGMSLEEIKKQDTFNRFEWGIPPARRGDMAFVQHMLYSLADNGTMATVLPHGVLFRGLSEEKIRKTFIDLNYLDAVIGLPERVLFGTMIPSCIMVFKKNRDTKDILFIDASGEENYEKTRNYNRLKKESVDKIVETYKEFKVVNKFSYKAKYEEIVENEYNLNIPRYVDTFEDEDPVDIEKVSKEIKELRENLNKVENKMDEYLRKLEL